jgi:glutaredoxin
MAISPGDGMRVVLYTRQGCHLCDDALDLLRRHGLNPQIVDIDADPELRSRFDHCVPVVEIDGKVRFRGRVNPLLLSRLWNAHSK